MDKRLSDILNGREENYLFPFYWQRGDHTEKIPEQIQRIYKRAGCPDSCRLVVGDGGHRFYAHPSWEYFAELSGWKQ